MGTNGTNHQNQVFVSYPPPCVFWADVIEIRYQDNNVYKIFCIKICLWIIRFWVFIGECTGFIKYQTTCSVLVMLYYPPELIGNNFWDFMNVLNLSTPQYCRHDTTTASDQPITSTQYPSIGTISIHQKLNYIYNGDRFNAKSMHRTSL